MKLVVADVDLFSRAVLGWKIADSMHAGLVTAAIGQALRSGPIAPDKYLGRGLCRRHLGRCIEESGH